jgi:hypothetical protein
MPVDPQVGQGVDVRQKRPGSQTPDGVAVGPPARFQLARHDEAEPVVPTVEISHDLSHLPHDDGQATLPCPRPRCSVPIGGGPLFLRSEPSEIRELMHDQSLSTLCLCGPLSGSADLVRHPPLRAA